MSNMKNTTDTDWKFVAVECQRKLNLIAGELNSWKKTCASADCVFMVADIIKKFHLDSESVGVPHPEYAELLKKLDAITALVARLKFASVNSREYIINDLYRLLPDFELNFRIFGAFLAL